MDIVDLPVSPPLEPMLAKAQAKVPTDLGVWSYEPKWDGFRALVFRDGDEIVLLSRSGWISAGTSPSCSSRCATSWRRAACSTARWSSHGRSAAASGWTGNRSRSAFIRPPVRVKMLAEQTPAHFIGFDALATGDTSLMREPFRVRRAALADAVNDRLSVRKAQCHVTRTTEDPGQGAQWLDTFEGAGLDGVIAKLFDGPYLPGKRYARS